jgi:hypothetical protein
MVMSDLVEISTDGMTEASDKQARRAARRIGLLARKSRWRRNTVDNHGGFMLLEPYQNRVVAGLRFNLTAADVVTRCNEELEKR